VLSSAVKLAIILSTILSTFATTAPDLCGDVFLNANGDPVTDLVGQTLARYCKWTGPDAPVWNANVCCTIDHAGAACSKTSSTGRCTTGTKKMYCEYGAALPNGGVTCYQPLPDACDAGLCVQAPEIIPIAQMSELSMCCSAGGACQYVHADNVEDCQGQILFCAHGSVDNDGNVECIEQ
jgi:hypothetical protein